MKIPTWAMIEQQGTHLSLHLDNRQLSKICEAAQDCDPWEKGNKWGELYNWPCFLPWGTLCSAPVGEKTQADYESFAELEKQRSEVKEADAEQLTRSYVPEKKGLGGRK